MKQRVTISMDAEVLSAARRDARSKGVSLSTFIERSLKDVVETEMPTFASRWRGQFKPAERDDPRYNALAKKYLR